MQSFGMRMRGLTENYILRCDKLFSTCVPARLQRKRLSNVKSDEAARCYKTVGCTRQSARPAQPSIGQILESSKEFHHGAWRLLKESQRLYTPDYEGRRLHDLYPLSMNERLNNSSLDFQRNRNTSFKPSLFDCCLSLRCHANACWELNGINLTRLFGTRGPKVNESFRGCIAAEVRALDRSDTHSAPSGSRQDCSRVVISISFSKEPKRTHASIRELLASRGSRGWSH